MTTFKASLTKLENKDVAIVLVDKKNIDKPDELKKYLHFYQELFKIENVALMMLDYKDDPTYYGKKELVELVKKVFWKQYHWKEYSLEKT